MKSPRMIAVLPTMLTLGNAVCGFGAITLAAKLGPEVTSDKHLLVAALLIFLGMLFDMLDGSVARLMKQTSDIGAQLDSLCDAITFGVAPAFLMLQFIRHQHHPESPDLFAAAFPSRFLWTIAALYVVCAIMRLARFNVETDDDDTHEYFSGLPSPAAAGAVAAFPFAMPELLRIAVSTDSPQVAMWLVPGAKVVMLIVTLLVAGLMVSRIRYSHVLSQWLHGQQTRRHVIQIVFAAAVIFWNLELALPVIFCSFAFGGPIRALWNELVSQRLYKSPSV